MSVRAPDWPDDLGVLTVVAGARALAQAAAGAAVASLTTSVERHGSAAWVLAGGGTPAAAYRLLAAGRHGAVPWERVRIAVGDERAVPHSDPDSNWGQATAALLDHVPVPPEARLVPRTELDAEAAAADYARQLEQLPKTVAGWPRFDALWLGVGEDGHCLSLFPGHPALEVADRLVTAVHDSPKPPPDRISLTLPALRGVGCCLILAAGPGKAEALASVRLGDFGLPVARAAREIVRAGGTVRWLLDEAAAGHPAE